MIQQFRKLNSNDIHLGLAFPDVIHERFLLKEYHKMMSIDETKRYKRFHFEKDQHRFLISRALTRCMLSRYSGIKPADLRFRTNSYGRPELVPYGNVPNIRFNLSHTNGLVICAVTQNRDIGVDVEDFQRKKVSLSIATRFFAHSEAEALKALPAEMQLDRFFDLWTLKESYIKARGMGLSIPLNQFAFHHESNGSIRITFDSKIGDNPDDWQFWRLLPTNHHRVALCVRGGSNQQYILSIKKIVPLDMEHDFNCPML